MSPEVAGVGSALQGRRCRQPDVLREVQVSFSDDGDQVDTWKPGERWFVPALYARPLECEILAVDDDEVRFRTPSGEERSISRRMLRHLLTHQASPPSESGRAER
ncbi:hypothetical protein QT366_22485 [Xanthomonas citri pv. citri]